MTEQFCGNGHTVNPGESVCVRCGTAAVSPVVPPGEASAEQIAAATGESQNADNDQQTQTDSAESTDTTGTETGSETSTEETKPEGEVPGDLASQAEAEQSKE